MITLVSAMDMANGIGTADNKLLFHLPKDLRHFRSVTSGKIVVMGRKTWDSLPKKPLERRKNYVLTRDENFNPIGANVLHSIDEVLKLSKKHDIYIIGGAEIYEQMLPYANKMILTFVHAFDYRAVAFFPDYDEKQWRVTSIQKHEEDKQHKHSFTFATLERK